MIKLTPLLIFLCFGLALVNTQITTEEYLRLREQIVEKDISYEFDRDVLLDRSEKKVDQILNQQREILLKQYSKHRFIFANNFRAIKADIENNPVFSILSTMPKGGVLHVHAIGDAWFLVQHGSYEPDCWMSVSLTNPDRVFQFLYSQTIPPAVPGATWKRVVDVRRASYDPAAFDIWLWNRTQFWTPPNEVPEDAMWDNFDETIGVAASLASKESVWRAYINHALDTLYADGIIHFEMRGEMNFIRNQTYPYEQTYSTAEIIRIWLKILDEFNSKHNGPNMTMSIIASYVRTGSIEKMDDDLMRTAKLMEDPVIGKYVVGFDIVDDEDRYYTLLHYLPCWIKIGKYLAANNRPPMKYYFHAGETVKFKRLSENLYDAFLLNTTRIGHGFALANYPYLATLAKDRGVAIEVSPISNQLLRLVTDMRDHHALEFLSQGLAVTINSDDPLIYGNHGLTYDFWASYMSWNLTLSGLKKLSSNSIQYSSLPEPLKITRLAQLKDMWNVWIQTILNQTWA